MGTRRRYWIALSLALSSTVGCATPGSFNLWPSGGSSWFGGGDKASPSNPASQTARNAPPATPSKSGANAQLGAAAAAPAGTWATMTAPLKNLMPAKDAPATVPDDALSLENSPKELSSDLHAQMARMFESKGDFPGAIKQYEQALKASPGNTDLLVGLARAYDRKGDQKKAIETYQAAIKADPKCASAYNDLGLCYARQRDLARSRESLGRAVALVPTSKLYRNNMATVFTEARQYKEAFEQLSAVHPPAIAHYNLGILANRKGDRTEALNRFQQAAAADPSLAQARKMVDKLSGVAQQQPELPAAGQRVQHLEQQAQRQVGQVKSQVRQTRAGSVSQAQAHGREAQSQVSKGAAGISQSAQESIREAEAKIRGAVQPQTAPIAPSYGNAWVPDESDDITPIQASPPVEERVRQQYRISDESDENPILLPPTSE